VKLDVDLAGAGGRKRVAELFGRPRYPQRIACAIRSNSMIETLPFPASIWAI
jgi:hypothetical protein